MVRAALFLGALFVVAACGGKGHQSKSADADQAVREYFAAISANDATMLCHRIDPGFGLFIDEQNCLDVETYAVKHDYSLQPHYSDDSPFTPVPMLRAVQAVTAGNRASASATVAWSAEHDGERRLFGNATLSLTLIHVDGSWRVSSIRNSAMPPSGGPAVEAVSRTVFEYYEAAQRAVAHDSQTGFYSTRPTELREHRERVVLGAIQAVEFRNDYAAATVDVHDVSNGAIGHPQRFKLVLQGQNEAWLVVANSDPAYALFGE